MTSAVICWGVPNSRRVVAALETHGKEIVVRDGTSELFGANSQRLVGEMNDTEIILTQCSLVIS
jgi:hypothetical protein